MNAKRLIDSLERFPPVVGAFVRDLSPEHARRRPPCGTWSVLEIVTHLADEEVEDFRCRVERTLRDPTAPWPPIDPEGWALERNYNDGCLETTMARFVSERHVSVAWLVGLDAPEWSRTYAHPKLGSIRAGDLLVSWVAHDALHLRQLAKRLYQCAQRDGEPYATDYAGDWRA